MSLHGFLPVLIESRLELKVFLQRQLALETHSSTVITLLFVNWRRIERKTQSRGEAVPREREHNMAALCLINFALFEVD